MKVKILMVDLIYKRIDELRKFWEKFLIVIEGLHIAREYDEYVYLLGYYISEVFSKYSDFLKNVSPSLYGIVPTIDTILEIEDEEERKEELRKIMPPIWGEIEKLWNNIEEIIIDSYKDVLYDTTDSDELVQAYMRGVRESIIPKLRELKDKRERMIELNSILATSILHLFREVERLVMWR
ncbi:MAG: hypothetical protein N2V75_00355 [Methanophagales archaeon]|nr:hypothetical protein [Methanophagales archaeon]